MLETRWPGSPVRGGGAGAGPRRGRAPPPGSPSRDEAAAPLRAQPRAARAGPGARRHRRRPVRAPRRPSARSVAATRVPALRRHGAGLDRAASPGWRRTLGARARALASERCSAAFAGGSRRRSSTGSAARRRWCSSAAAAAAWPGPTSAPSQLLEQYGLVPRLLRRHEHGRGAGCSSAPGAVRWHAEDVAGLLGQLSFRTLFRFLQAGSRYGLPAAMRLYLRAAIGEHLRGPDGHAATLAELAIPLVVAVTGVAQRRPAPRPELLRAPARPADGRAPPAARAGADGRRRLQAPSASSSSAGDRLRPRLPGRRRADRATSTPSTRSASPRALPGVIHYDVLRDDPRMRGLLDELFERHGISSGWSTAGWSTTCRPARRGGGAARRDGARATPSSWRSRGSRPSSRQPLWFGLEQLAAQNVARNRPFVHLYRSFQRVLSPLDVVPTAGSSSGRSTPARRSSSPTCRSSRACAARSPAAALTPAASTARRTSPRRSPLESASPRGACSTLTPWPWKAG